MIVQLPRYLCFSRIERISTLPTHRESKSSEVCGRKVPHTLAFWDLNQNRSLASVLCSRNTNLIFLPSHSNSCLASRKDSQNSFAASS